MHKHTIIALAVMLSSTAANASAYNFYFNDEAAPSVAKPNTNTNTYNFYFGGNNDDQNKVPTTPTVSQPLSDNLLKNPLTSPASLTDQPYIDLSKGALNFLNIFLKEVDAKLAQPKDVFGITAKPKAAERTFEEKVSDTFKAIEERRVAEEAKREEETQRATEAKRAEEARRAAEAAATTSGGGLLPESISGFVSWAGGAALRAGGTAINVLNGNFGDPKTSSYYRPARDW